MQPTSIIMLGATGAVGGEALKALLKDPRAERITLLGRRDIPAKLPSRANKRAIFAASSMVGRAPSF